MPEAVQALVMRAGIVVNVTPDDRRRLEAIVGDRNAPQQPVWRAKIILATADGCDTTEITRTPGKPPLPGGTVQGVVDLALGPPPGEATHWTGRMLAKVAGVSLRSVQRLLEAHPLAPHRIPTFKQSNHPKF